MEFERIYLYIFLVLMVAFFAMMCIYLLYTLQKKVTSVAMTSADVAFFPVRATAFAIRLFFRMVAFCFDTTLFGLRIFLVSVRLVLSGLETALLIWRVPILVLLSILQRIANFRKSTKTKAKIKTEEASPNQVKENHVQDRKEEDEETKIATKVYRGALLRIRKARQLLRPDLFILQKSGWLFRTHKYLQSKAGLEKTEITANGQN